MVSVVEEHCQNRHYFIMRILIIPEVPCKLTNTDSQHFSHIFGPM